MTAREPWDWAVAQLVTPVPVALLVGWTDDTGAVTLEAPAGSIVAFSGLLLHATGANRTDKLRRVYLAQYNREVMLNPGTRQLRNNAVPLLLKGEIAAVA